MVAEILEHGQLTTDRWLQSPMRKHARQKILESPKRIHCEPVSSGIYLRMLPFYQVEGAFALLQTFGVSSPGVRTELFSAMASLDET